MNPTIPSRPIPAATDKPIIVPELIPPPPPLLGGDVGDSEVVELEATSEWVPDEVNVTTGIDVVEEIDEVESDNEEEEEDEEDGRVEEGVDDVAGEEEEELELDVVVEVGVGELLDELDVLVGDGVGDEVVVGALGVLVGPPPTVVSVGPCRPTIPATFLSTS